MFRDAANPSIDIDSLARIESTSSLGRNTEVLAMNSHQPSSAGRQNGLPTPAVSREL